MAVEFLTDAQVAAYGRFVGVPSRADLERFFLLDDADKALIEDRRGDHNRLGFMFQATTVRYLGVFLEDPLDVPWPVVEYLAGQLGIADASCVKRYTARAKTAYEHAWECVERVITGRPSQPARERQSPKYLPIRRQLPSYA